MKINYLIVGGGASGGNGYSYPPGAGGGGGFLDGIIDIDLLPKNIVVGIGGVGTIGIGFGVNGGQSSFKGLVALGGGGGGFGDGYAGNDGGCGGGGGGASGGAGSQGGNGSGGGAYYGGGGGGAGGNAILGGQGGIGKASIISGASILYGVGASWGTVAQQPGSNYGRGAPNVSGIVNGYDGIVILSLPIGAIVGAKGGVHTQANGNDIWTFTASGIWTPVALSPFISRIII